MGMFGGKSSPPTIQAAANPYDVRLARQAKQYYNETEPIRTGLENQYTSILSGNYNPESLPGYQPLYGATRSGLEGQYNQAKNTIMENVPQGGALSGQLAGLASQRASQVGAMPAQLSSGIISNLMNQAYGMGTGAVSTSNSGLGQVGSTYGSSQNVGLLGQEQSYQQQMNQMGQLGMGLGQLGAQSGLFSAIGKGSGSSAGGLGTMCCFIFIEANGGVLHPIVRRYRDEHMTEQNRRGYYRLADKLVPLMKKHKLVYHAVRFLMTEPMTSYGKWFYGVSWVGKIFKPAADFWIKVFDRLGSGGRYTRSNGEVI